MKIMAARSVDFWGGARRPEGRKGIDGFWRRGKRGGSARQGSGERLARRRPCQIRYYLPLSWEHGLVRQYFEGHDHPGTVSRTLPYLPKSLAKSSLHDDDGLLAISAAFHDDDLGVG